MAVSGSNMSRAAHKTSILITGSSSGIGECAALGLRSRGYRVIATARKPADVERLSSQGFDALELNLADPQSIAAAVEAALRLTDGRLDALFNNGGFGQLGALEDISYEALWRQFEVNVFGPHELARLVIPVMRAQGHGRIIQNSSLLGLVALRYRGAYNASKHALEALSDTLRLELRGSGIHVSLIEPGPIRSRFRENAYSVYRERVMTHNPHGAGERAIEHWLEEEDRAGWFILPPQVVVKKLIHALESPRPKARYFVTLPTYVLAFLKRILPDRALDAMLSRI